ncbi:MAG TPA: alpha/beta fold hydrolase [Candidatus Binatia bacterium]|nr:alpha/beta fold hydrolase [Candidatus Binatia bacterium]
MVAQRRLTSTVLSTGNLSIASENTLRRYFLTERFEDAPEHALVELHAAAVRNDDQNALFALSELSFYQARATGQQSYYLASAVYAYAFLFPDGAGTPPSPIDPRLRMACDFYNRSLASAFASEDGKEVKPQAGVFPLPFGWLSVTFDDSQLIWAKGRRLSHFVSAADLQVSGLNNRYIRPGIGTSLAASTEPLNSAQAADDFIAPKVKVPTNLLLRIEQPRQALASGYLRGALELRTDTDASTVQIDNQNLPLEYEPTAVIAYQLSESTVWQRELRGFFLGDLLRIEKNTSLVAVSPPQPGLIPLVFIHGTASSAGRWADLVNDLLSDPRIHNNYEFWFFTYDTGNPIAYSAARLRQALRAAVQRFDPDGKDPAMHQMVLIGHSQGGLLAKMMAIDSGTKLWDNVSKVPLEQFKVSDTTRELLQESLFVKPLPFVRRVIFMCTPQHGSYQAGGRVIHWITRFMKLPGDVLDVGKEAMQGNADKLKIAANTGIPTSIHNMTPTNPFVQTLATIPVAPQVAAHSIIAVKGEGPPENGNDGIVEYKSAHIDGVESELVVNSGHSAQSNPHTVEEVRRILLLQANESCARYGINCVKQFRKEESTGAGPPEQPQ